MRKKIVVGLDFDGVVAYNPARIFRLPIALVKKHLLGIKGTSFYVPHGKLAQAIWTLMFSSSVVPAKGVGLLRKLVDSGTIEAHLVTGRFSFMEGQLERWLRGWRMDKIFASITTNSRDEQPHLFKEQVIKRRRFDYYIEDNLDIVRYLTKKTKTKIFWIFNILDRTQFYPSKYPFLEKALEAITAR